MQEASAKICKAYSLFEHAHAFAHYNQSYKRKNDMVMKSP
jgi:hypothetical protein